MTEQSTTQFVPGAHDVGQALTQTLKMAKAFSDRVRSRENSLTVTKLEEALMWFVKGVSGGSQ
jgi:hypothetical protein